MADMVNHPSHYNTGKIEVIDFIEDQKLDFHAGQVVKYVARAGKKDPAKELEDLQKAQWYLERKIKNLKLMRMKLATLELQRHPGDPVRGETWKGNLQGGMKGREYIVLGITSSSAPDSGGFVVNTRIANTQDTESFDISAFRNPALFIKIKEVE